MGAIPARMPSLFQGWKLFFVYTSRFYPGIRGRSFLGTNFNSLEIKFVNWMQLKWLLDKNENNTILNRLNIVLRFFGLQMCIIIATGNKTTLFLWSFIPDRNGEKYRVYPREDESSLTWIFTVFYSEIISRPTHLTPGNHLNAKKQISRHWDETLHGITGRDDSCKQALKFTAAVLIFIVFVSRQNLNIRIRQFCQLTVVKQ